jgi:hypothetical protein
VFSAIVGLKPLRSHPAALRIEKTPHRRRLRHSYCTACVKR